MSGSTETYIFQPNISRARKKRLQKIKLKITAEAYQQGKDDFLNHWFQATLRGITKAIKFWKKFHIEVWKQQLRHKNYNGIWRWRLFKPTA